MNTADTKWRDYDTQITPGPKPGADGVLLLGLTAGMAAWHRHGGRRRA